jgi:hypothetical protein
MDAVNTCARPFSILIDNDSPSFAVRPRHTHISPPELHLAKQERILLGQIDHIYQGELSSPTPATPPLSRLNSVSSKGSSSIMDSPSPRTPVYNYDPQLVAPYDPMLRQDSSAYLPSPSSTITPLIDSMMIGGPGQEQIMSYQSKAPNTAMSTSYQAIPLSPTSDPRQQPTTSSASKSQLHLQQAVAGSNTSQPKKNKYPCPYAASHHCTAAFTTSGHAARHGKKHTGEKGVHCPVCNKAFTRKDNMKQHERTHKGSGSGSISDDTNSKRSKAALTKEAVRAKQAANNVDRSTSGADLIHSPLTEVASIDPSVIGSQALADDRAHYPNVPMTGKTEIPRHVSNYPPLGDEPAFANLSHLDRNAESSLSHQQPPMQRAFSDLDTLAMAAAYDPYSQADLRR